MKSPKEGFGTPQEGLRKKIERLEATEQNFRVLCENVPAYFAYIGADERYVFANKLHETLFGIPSEDIAGMRLPDLIGDEAYEYAKPHIDRVLSGEEVRDEAELPFRGRCLSIRMNLMPDINENQRVVGFFALATDDTAEKEAARTVQESRDRLASVLETVAEAIVSIDRAGRIDGFNPAAELMFGYAADEVIGKNVRILMPEPYRSEHDRYIERYLETREARIIGEGREAVARRKDGTTFPIELAVSEIDHQERFTGIIRDITKRKRTEAALELSREELRMLSARLLTAEESERRRISRELHDDINQRLAMLSIDLEGLAGTEGLNREARATLVELQDQVSSLSDDVHAMAYRLHPAILDDLGLPAAVRALAEDFSPRHRGITVSFRERHFPTQIGMQLSSCLYRVVQESLTNIAKHSKSPRVRIRLVGTPRGVRLSIRDFGLGFDVQSARNYKRTLGIVSMEERVRLAGGVLRIWSVPGKGTRILVTIPFSS